MSGEEDTELRDLVAQTLENNGVLSKIRAELRASVFLALEEQESSNAKQPFLNKPLKQFLRTTEGAMAASLVREFLEFFTLEYSLSVFEPESYCGREFCSSGREELAKQLGLQGGDKKKPLISLLLQNIQFGNSTANSNNTTVNMTEPIVNGKSSPEFDKFATPEEKPSSPIDKVCTPPQHSPKIVASATLTEEASNNEKKEENNVDMINNLTRTLEALDTTLEEMNNTSLLKGQCKDTKSPLGALPPLQISSPSRQTDKGLDQLKALMDLASPSDSMDNYEEDFQSSVSGSQAEPRVSVSEDIEEEVGSEAPSSGSGVEDLTLDTTISLPDHVMADLLESV